MRFTCRQNLWKPVRFMNKANNWHTISLGIEPARLAFIAFSFAGLYLTRLQSFTLFHTLVELFSIVVACGMYFISWNAREFVKNNFLLFLGMSYLIVAGLDLFHLMVFEGMMILPEHGFNASTQLWISARFLESVSLLIAPFTINRRINYRIVWILLISYFVLTLISVFHLKIFPECFVEGVGLTNFKIVSEYVISLILVCAIVALFRKRFYFSPDILRLLFLSIGFTVLQELVLTVYTDANDFSILLGHYFKILSFYLLYIAIIRTSLQRPYQTLFQDLEQEKLALQEARNELQSARDQLNRRVFEQSLDLERRNRELTEEREKLLHLSHRNNTILASAWEGIFGIDLQGNYTFVNPAAAMMLGLDIPGIIGGPADLGFWSRITVGGTWPGCDSAMGGRFKAGDPIHSDEEIFRRRDGSEIPVELAMTPVFEKGELTGAVVTLWDITRRKQSEQKLLQSEANLKSFLNAIPESSFLISRDGTILIANEAFARLNGLTVQEAIGSNIFDVLPSEVVQTRRKFVDEVIREGKPLQLTDVREGKIMRTNAYPIFNRDGFPERIAIYAADITEAKRLQESLRKSEERYRTIVELSPTGIFVIVNGRFVYSNEKFRKILGLDSQTEIIGQEILDFIHPDCHEVARQRVSYILETGRPVPRMDQVYVRLDGASVDVEASATLFNLEDQPGILVIINDVSDRKRAEVALRESEERFRQVADTAGEWIWETDSDGLFTYCSSAVERILGYKPDQLVGLKHFSDFFGPSINEAVAERTLEIFRAKKLFRNVRTYYVRKDGETVILETSGAPVLDLNGNVVGYRGTHSNITQSVRAAESRELLAAVVEHAAESIIITDSFGIIKYVNPAFEKTSGYSRDEVIGQNPRLLKSGKQDDSFYRDLWQTISQGEVWRGRFSNLKKDGTIFEEEATISPIKRSDGRIRNYMAIKRDVTKEVALQGQLFQSQKMEAIGTLAGGIAHDFNNIIFAMIGYTELALDEQPEDSESHHYLEQVLDAGMRAREMVKQILTFSRQSEPQRKLLDLAPIIKEGLKFLRASIPPTIEINTKIETSHGLVEVDPTQIHQVLMNLCTNAVYAMKDTKGVLSVELSSVEMGKEILKTNMSLIPGKYVRLAVSDTGLGIAPDIMGRIFDPYFTTKKLGEGTGLGLSVIHGIVTAHGGTITVKSQPGLGSTFEIFLPVRKSESEFDVRLPDEPCPSGSGCVLFVDDEQTIVELGEAILESLGYAVVAVMNPIQALEIVRSNPKRFDLVITDLMMPKMTGLELAHEIKALRQDIPIIVCTGYGNDFTPEQAEESGIKSVILKPISKRELARSIREVMQR